MIGIIDYGLGNLSAFSRALTFFDIPCLRVTNVDELQKATKLILPGVGSFDEAMRRLNASGLREGLDHYVLDQGVDVLGVCVGMQIMAAHSEEGELPGLGWVDATVKRFRQDGNVRLRVPHMGWNNLEVFEQTGIFEGMSSPFFYFLHSYMVCPANDAIVAGRADYGGNFCAAFVSGNIHGVQFHPEKSHEDGMRVLKNFALN